MIRTLGLILVMLLPPALVDASEQRETDSRELASSTGHAGLRAPNGFGSGGPMELRLNEKLWVLQPFVGGLGSPRGQWHAYAGRLVDVRMGPYFTLTLSFAPGVYHSGTDPAVGLALELRSLILVSSLFPLSP